MNISYQLISQHFNDYLVHRIIPNILKERGNENYRYQDLKVELWYNCIWTNYGFISYFDYAEGIKWFTIGKAQQLPVKTKGENLFLVKGVQRDWYAVCNGKCECMLYQQRKERQKELPQFFQWFTTFPFCHHTQAVKNYQN